MAPRRDLLEATPLAMQWLDDLPPILREEPDVQAIYYCAAKEFERLAVVREDVRRQLNPATATRGLKFWEQLLRLPVGVGTNESRQLAIIARMARLQADPSGRDWVHRVQARLGANVLWSYLENIPGNPTSPAPQTLRISLPYGVNTEQFRSARAAIREETASELAITYTAQAGFLWDVSLWDVDTWGA